MGFFSSLRERITWEWEFGVNKVNKSLYRLEFTSRPIRDSVFRGIAEKQIKHAVGKDVGEFKVGEFIELPVDVLNHYGQAILFSLPSVRPKGEKLLSRGVVSVSYTREDLGWVIRVAVEGVRRLF